MDEIRLKGPESQERPTSLQNLVREQTGLTAPVEEPTLTRPSGESCLERSLR